MTNGNRQSGLSLLEMIVVLTLISMLSTVLFQGYAYLMGSYVRLEARQQERFEEVLREGWLRNVWAGLVPSHEDERRFAASSRSMSGFTFSPLLSQAGVATYFQLSLERVGTEEALVYTEAGFDPIYLKRWRASRRAAFRYLQWDGQWLSAWELDGRWQLPRALQLQHWGDSGEAITAMVIMRRLEDVPITDVLYGRD